MKNVIPNYQNRLLQLQPQGSYTLLAVKNYSYSCPLIDLRWFDLLNGSGRGVSSSVVCPAGQAFACSLCHAHSFLIFQQAHNNFSDLHTSRNTTIHGVHACMNAPITRCTALQIPICTAPDQLCEMQCPLGAVSSQGFLPLTLLNAIETQSCQPILQLLQAPASSCAWPSRSTRYLAMLQHPPRLLHISHAPKLTQL